MEEEANDIRGVSEQYVSELMDKVIQFRSFYLASPGRQEGGGIQEDSFMVDSR